MLSPRAREEWRRLAPALRELGLLTVGDVAIMISYCETYAEIVELTELMQTLDSLMDRVEIYRQRSAAMTRLNALTRKLGLDPRARTNLAPPPAPEPEGAEFDEFADGEAEA